MSEWSHLPNAAHIDYVIEQTRKITAQGAARDAARDAAWDAAWGAAQGAAWGAAQGAAWDAAWDAARGAARGAARDAARGAALALVAWDDCSHWIYTDPEIIRAHIAVTDDFAARLIYPFALLNHELLKA